MKAQIDYKLIQDNENALDVSYKGIFHIDESNSKFKLTYEDNTIIRTKLKGREMINDRKRVTTVVDDNTIIYTYDAEEGIFDENPYCISTVNKDGLVISNEIPNYMSVTATYNDNKDPLVISQGDNKYVYEYDNYDNLMSMQVYTYSNNVESLGYRYEYITDYLGTIYYGEVFTYDTSNEEFKLYYNEIRKSN